MEGRPRSEGYRAGGRAQSELVILKNLKSVAQLGKEKGDDPLPENESVEPRPVIQLGEKVTPDQVREGKL